MSNDDDGPCGKHVLSQAGVLPPGGASYAPSPKLPLPPPPLQVVNTPWWPPGTEDRAESVGLISRGRVFMTAMMASNASSDLTFENELSDVKDIAIAAGTNLSGLVRCLVNAKVNQSDSLRSLVEKALEPYGRPAVSVIEAAGEYYGTFDFSLECQAHPSARTALRTTLSLRITSLPTATPVTLLFTRLPAQAPLCSCLMPNPSPHKSALSSRNSPRNPSSF